MSATVGATPPTTSQAAQAAAVERPLPVRSVSHYLDDVVRTGRVLSAYGRTLERLEGTSGRARRALLGRLRNQTLAFARTLASMRKYRVQGLVVERQRRRLTGPAGRKVVRALRRLNTAINRGNEAAIASALVNLTERVEAWQPRQL